MGHVSRTHGVAFAWLFDRTNLDPKIQFTHVETKVSFTRDEWKSSSVAEYHEVLDVLLQPFLCHVEERARRFFKRRFGDGEAETNEFGVAQPLECEEEPSARHVRFQKTPENAKAEQGGVSSGIWKQMRDTSQNPAVYSQMRQQEDTQNANTGKQERRSDFSDSTGIWKQMRGVETHVNRAKMDFHNMQISPAISPKILD